MFDMLSRKFWELQRIFLKSEYGFTPLVLAHSTDDFDAANPRRWIPFLGQLGVSERELVQNTSKAICSGGPYWHRNGVFQDDSDILEWIHSGCENSYTLEEILSQNPGVELLVGKEHHPTQSESLRTTEDLDDWIEKSRSYVNKIICFSIAKRLVLPREDPLFPKDRHVILQIDPFHIEDFKSFGYYGGSHKTLDGKIKPILVRQDWEAAVMSLNRATEVAISLNNLYISTVAFFDYVPSASYSTLIALSQYQQIKSYDLANSYVSKGDPNPKRGSIPYWINTPDPEDAYVFENDAAAQDYIDGVLKDHADKWNAALIVHRPTGIN